MTRWSFVSPAQIEQVFARAAAAGFNAVFFQVRGRADALYRSSLEPWAEELTGQLGQDPGFDPLQVALDAGARLGLQVHAWVNVVPVWRGANLPPETTPRHILLEHPDWRMVDDQGRPMPVDRLRYTCLSPANPAARAHLVAVVAELLDRYPVDGLHLDYIRYCGREYSLDPVSERGLAAARQQRPGLARAQWQREQVTQLVRDIHAVTRRHRALLSAAVWHNNDLDVPGSRGARDYYQDSHAWTREGLVDAIVPMNYLRLDRPDSFAVRVDDHLAHAFGRRVWMGVHALGRIRDRDPSGDAMAANIAYARQAGVDGVVVFSSDLLDAAGLWGRLRRGPFAGTLD